MGSQTEGCEAASPPAASRPEMVAKSTQAADEEGAREAAELRARAGVLQAELLRAVEALEANEAAVAAQRESAAAAAVEADAAAATRIEAVGAAADSAVAAARCVRSAAVWVFRSLPWRVQCGFHSSVVQCMQYMQYAANCHWACLMHAAGFLALFDTAFPAQC